MKHLPALLHMFSLRAGVLFALCCGVLPQFSHAGETAGVDGVVVASRGTASVMLADVDAMVKQLPANVRAGYMDGPERIEKMIDNLLLARQIAGQAREKGLDNSDEFIRRMQMSADNILMQMQVEAHLESLDAPDFSIRAREMYMVDDGSKYGIPSSRDVSHILVSRRDRSEDAAAEIAGSLLQRIQAGESFDELARIYSDDKPGNMPEGDIIAGEYWRMKNVLPGKTVKEFETAAWALESPGDLSGVVNTQFGFHIIRLDAIHPARKKSFEDVQDSIVEGLRNQWIEERRLQYLTSFRAEALEANPDIVASLRTRYRPDPATIKTKRIKATLND